MWASDRKKRVLVGVAIVSLVTTVSALWIGLRVGGAACARDFDDLVTAMVAIIATLFCFRAARRECGRMRVFWGLTAGACLCWAVAEVTWAVYELLLGVRVPILSWADVGYLSAIPLVVAALLSHPGMHRTRTRKVRSLFDSLIVATALAFLSWTLVVGQLWHSTDLSTLAGLVALAYPFGDVVIVFFIVVVVRRIGGDARLALWCLLAGLVVMAVSDSTYSYLSTINSFPSGGIIDVGWIAAYLTIGLAAFASEPSSLGVVDTAGPDAPTFASFLAPLVLTFVALAVAGLELQLGRHLDTAGTVMAFALVSLVLVRQTVFALELSKTADSAEADWLRRLVRAALSRASVAPTGHDHPPQQGSPS